MCSLLDNQQYGLDFCSLDNVWAPFCGVQARALMNNSRLQWPMKVGTTLFFDELLYKIAANLLCYCVMAKFFVLFFFLLWCGKPSSIEEHIPSKTAIYLVVGHFSSQLILSCLVQVHSCDPIFDRWQFVFVMCIKVVV